MRTFCYEAAPRVACLHEQEGRSTFRIFFVCTGNQARSPIAAAWTGRALSDLPVEVGSAGTLPRRSGPVLAEAATVASEMGLDVTPHRSSHVAKHDLSSVDLVVGFELNHVAAAVVDARAAAERSFLLRELNGLLADVPLPEGDPLTRARESIRRAEAIRRTRGGFVAGQEIKDPAGRKLPDFRAIVGEVVDSCDEMCALLFRR